MWASPLLIAALALGAPADVRNRHLAEGIDRYEALDYAGALQSLTAALDQQSSRHDFAKIHLYIGLIQHRYKLKDDAEASFGKALDYDAKVKLPKTATKGARALFTKIRKAKFGDIEPGESRADEVRKKRRLRPLNRGEGEGDGAIEPTSTSTGAALASAAGGALRGDNSASDASENGSHRAALDENDELPTVRAKVPSEGSRAFDPAAGTARTEPSSSTPVAGWISVGIGAAALATGVTLGFLAAKNGSDALNEQVANRSAELHATAVEQRALAFVSFGVSGAALGLAAVLFLTE
jgi:hypothetical protein